VSGDEQSLVYRWDLDKTYLRTEFDTLRDLLRTALENARQKTTVPGAAALLRELRATRPAGIFILSGSPEQMRRVLEAKLRLDGIQWDTFMLKPSLRNLLRGRLRFVRDQLGYKLGALLESRATILPHVDEVLFGDDAEADAFIYSLYADIVAGRVGSDTLLAVLERARVYPDDIPELVLRASRLPHRDACRRIFIHLDRVSAPEGFDELGRRLCPFYNYLQPALVLLEEDLLSGAGTLRVAAELVIQQAFTADALAASYQDLARRQHIGRRAVELLREALDSAEPSAFAATETVLRAFCDEVASTDLPARSVPPESPAIDYVALFSRDRARARAARQRARSR